ncbi:hypothetical protein Poly24_21970 [Rosistilla carotiformis]|uniref:Uncharacterized protein n=1 Tax=Rosistilla carotiformis TaxID=2528017 RepID=A0A518JSI3_9BACT|nr:hypothetical protein Poly24_21970 [Rosistilla carotiformis]
MPASPERASTRLEEALPESSSYNGGATTKWMVVELAGCSIFQGLGSRGVVKPIGIGREDDCTFKGSRVSSRLT